MREMTFEEIRSIQLDMLQYLDTFCRKHGIEYSIGEGTLIGAMRHKGFIPWDDDIDVIMRRDEYQKFIAAYRDEKYPLIAGTQEREDFSLPFAKMVDTSTKVVYQNGFRWEYGIWLSIFPIDNYPDDDQLGEKLLKKAHWISHWQKVKDNRWMGRLLLTTIIRYLVVKYVPSYCIMRSYEKSITKYKNTHTQRVATLCFSWYSQPFICSASAFDEYIDVDFEHLKLKAIKGYDEYLRCQYGDWTQLPPEGQRICKHDYTAYWIDKE